MLTLLIALASACTTTALILAIVHGNRIVRRLIKPRLNSSCKWHPPVPMRKPLDQDIREYCALYMQGADVALIRQHASFF